MANQVLFTPNRALDSNAYALPGATATVYQTGTATLITLYSDESGSVTTSNPITADANGVFPQVFASVTPKVVVKDSDGATVWTIDPAPTTSSSATGASSISFSPTVDIPETNVQDAIEAAGALAISGVTAYGIGTTGNAPTIADLDATGTASGIYRFTAATTGTFPTGVLAATTGLVVFDRQTAAEAVQVMRVAGDNVQFVRTMSASIWGTWRELISVNQGSTEGDIMYRSSTAWTRLAKGTASQVLTMNSGATAPNWVGPGGAGVGLLTTTGAATVGPWSLPAGVKRFTVTSNKSSLSGTGNILVQLRVAGSFVTSGYESESNRGGSNISNTTGMVVCLGVAYAFWRGAMQFWLHDPATNLWLCKHEGSTVTAASDPVSGAGAITLAGVVDGIQINSTAGTFDVSSFNVFY